MPGLEDEDGVLASRLKAKAEEYVSTAEARGEELRPATIQELEAMEASAAKEETAETAVGAQLSDSPAVGAGAEVASVPAATAASHAESAVSGEDAFPVGGVPSSVTSSDESAVANEEITNEASE